MNLKIGIVGLANVGKSTLFNALLKKQVAFAANYPFATIEPNVGVVPVPDDRLKVLADIVEKEEGTRPPLVPAIVEFVDIAGLVKGAAQGQGLGNKFLSHIREVHIICHVVRYFEDPSVIHVADTIDPARDQDIVNTELILADYQTIEKQIEPRGGATKEQLAKWEIIKRLKEGLNSGKLASVIITDPEEKVLISDLHLLTMKPQIVVANVSEEQLASFRAGDDILPVCAKIESDLASLSSEDQKTYLISLGLSSSGLDRLIQKTYAMLGLISFLTCGVIEARAWTLQRGTKAPQAAGVIHTDFEKKFIKADVVPFDEFVTVGGWKTAREEGKVRSEGKEYEMKDGDVVEFKIGT